MCYWNKTEYRIIPTSSYQILRGCPGCGCRTAYVSTGNFRVNANGRRIDIWLVYQCGKCRHTYNLAIYERVRPEDIPGEEYGRFLENDGETALRYGTDKSVFARNRAEIDWECAAYEIMPIKEERELTGGQEDSRQKPGGGSTLVIDNPFELKIRTDKAVAQIAHLSRSRVRQLVKDGMLEIAQDYVGRRAVVELRQVDEESGPLSEKDVCPPAIGICPDGEKGIVKGRIRARKERK